MLNQQQYAVYPALGAGTSTTADTSYTQPTNSTVGVDVTALSSGARIEAIEGITLGTSVAGLLRLWTCEGTPGPTMVSITFVGTTATVTCSTPHGLSTGALITMQGVTPVDYNIKNTAVTVTSTTVFTYVMGTTPTVAAQLVSSLVVGQFSYTPATPVYHLWQEVPIVAITGSTTVPAFRAPTFNSVTNPDIMPLQLPAGWSLRHTVTVTQTSAMQITGRGGNN